MLVAIISLLPVALQPLPPCDVQSQVPLVQSQGTPFGRPVPKAIYDGRPAVLDAALQRPQLLLEFLTDPGTSLPEAIVAAESFRGPLAANEIGSLVRARIELDREFGMHMFGVKTGKHWSIPGGKDGKPFFAPEWTEMRGTLRSTLGQDWRIPKTQIDWPETWEQAMVAPWPWRAHQSVKRFAQSIGPTGYGAPARAWLAECSKLPLETPFDVQVYVESTMMARHLKTLEVLARWRVIALDPSFPSEAHRIAKELGEAARFSVDDEVHLACRVVAADILNASPHPAARRECASRLSTFLMQPFKQELDRTSSPPLGKEVERARTGRIPAGAVIAARRLHQAANLQHLESERYLYAKAICGLMQDPRFPSDSPLFDGGPAAGALEKRLDAWLLTLDEELQVPLEEERDMRHKLVALSK